MPTTNTTALEALKLVLDLFESEAMPDAGDRRKIKAAIEALESSAPSTAEPVALEALIRAGTMLSNIAFNLKQVDGQHHQAALSESQQEWDSALRNYRSSAPSAASEREALTDERIDALIPLPDCTYSDHSYPSYTKRKVREILRAALRSTGKPDGEVALPSSAAGAEPAAWREFVEGVAKQKPEKPDYWSSCSQCKRNASDAEDLLVASLRAKFQEEA